MSIPALWPRGLLWLLAIVLVGALSALIVTAPGLRSTAGAPRPVDDAATSAPPSY